MKIGVILHGQLRTGLSCAKYIKALFDDYDADFFIHHWDVSTLKWLDDKIYNNPTYTDKVIAIPNDEKHDNDYYHTWDEFNKIKEIYQPKYFSTSKKDDDYNLARENLNKEGEDGVMGYYSAFKALIGLSMYQNKTKNKYDLVIRMRPDAIVPKSEINGFKQALNLFKKNTKRFFCEYQVTPSNNLVNFPIIDYYQIANYNNMVELHKWLYEREVGMDTNLQTVINKLIDSNQLILGSPQFKTLIIRNIMDDEDYIKLLYENWVEDSELEFKQNKFSTEDIYQHMNSYYHPISHKEYYGEHVDEPLTKEKIISNVIKLYSK